MQQRGADRTIRSIKDDQGRIMKSPGDTANTFTTFLRKQIRHIRSGR